MAKNSKLRYLYYIVDQVFLSISFKFEVIILINSKDISVESCVDAAI